MRRISKKWSKRSTDKQPSASRPAADHHIQSLRRPSNHRAPARGCQSFPRQRQSDRPGQPQPWRDRVGFRLRRRYRRAALRQARWFSRARASMTIRWTSSFPTASSISRRIRTRSCARLFACSSEADGWPFPTSLSGATFRRQVRRSMGTVGRLHRGRADGRSRRHRHGADPRLQHCRCPSVSCR
jgi:hypothetical protein